MTITYIGKDNEIFENDRPFAIISYNEEKEEKKADKVFKILRDNGWDITWEEDMHVWLPFGRSDYEDLMADYKEAKRA